MNIYAQISKVEQLDDGTIRVHGVASTEAEDDQGEVVKAEAMRAALPDYMQYPALREMHQLQAAGTTLDASVDDDGVTRIVGHVVDPVAVAKVKNRVYRGFSIGGRVLEREPGSYNTITGLKLNEISLVDRPANPEAVMTMWKAGEAMEGGLATLGEQLAAKREVPKEGPTQLWGCGDPAHSHTKKAEAADCMAKRVVGPSAMETAILAAAEAMERARKAISGDNASPSQDAQKNDDGDKMPYGDVNYADPGYRNGKQRYPLDSEKHVRAAWSYINMPKNSKFYSADQLSSIKSKIKSAGKKYGIDFSDDKGKAAKAELCKALWNVGEVASTIMCLDNLKDSLMMERVMEGDDSDAPTKLEGIIDELCQFLRDLVAEETGEIMSGTEVSPADMMMAEPMMAMASALERLKADERIAKHGGKLAEMAEKARRSMSDQGLLNLAYHAARAGAMVPGISKMNAGHMMAAAESLEKAGAHALPGDYDRDNPDTQPDEDYGRDNPDTQPDEDYGRDMPDGMDMPSDEEDKAETPTPNQTPPAREHYPGRNATVDTSKAEQAVMELITEALGKRGGHVHYADVAHDAMGKMTDGMSCAKVGSRFSAATMGHLRAAHGHLAKAGAVCATAGDNIAMAATQAGSLDEMRKVTDQRDELAKAVPGLVDMIQKTTSTIEEMRKRLENIERQPLPNGVAPPGNGAGHLPPGVFAVGKGDDGRFVDHDRQVTEKGGVTPERLAAELAKMTEEERAIFQIRQAHRFPYLQG